MPKLHFLWRPTRLTYKQECIPVGCVPSAAVAAGEGGMYPSMYWAGGVCPGSVCPGGSAWGVSVRHRPPPPVNRMTDFNQVNTHYFILTANSAISVFIKDGNNVLSGRGISRVRYQFPQYASQSCLSVIPNKHSLLSNSYATSPIIFDAPWL